MAEKAKLVFWILAHTLLSAVAVLCAGFTVHLFAPVVGFERYHRLAKTPFMAVLLMIIVALWGFWLYRRWHDRRALFAWLLPAAFCIHLFIAGEWNDPQYASEWELGLVVLGCAAAYSLGAAFGAIFLRKRSVEHANSLTD